MQSSIENIFQFLALAILCKESVFAMLECGRMHEQVARRFSVSHSTILRLIRRVRATGTTADRPRSGRPCVTLVGQENCSFLILILWLT